MKHMIRPFGTRYSDEPKKVKWTIQKAQEHLSRAHKLLKRAGHAALKTAANTSRPNEHWGTTVKRELVRATSDKLLMTQGIAAQNLVEVINMCATVERVLDTLEWARGNGFSEYLVLCCHPTASSDHAARKKKQFDNDLVLVQRLGKRKQFARFEISDVSGEGDGNDKERKDLASLGVLNKPKKGGSPNDIMKIKQWPRGRIFLGISNEFAKVIKDSPDRIFRTGLSPHCGYLRPSLAGRKTTILEVIRGNKISFA
jgi:hypothetical protein